MPIARTNAWNALADGSQLSFWFPLGRPGPIAQRGAPPIRSKSTVIPSCCAIMAISSHSRQCDAGYAAGSVGLNPRGAWTDPGAGAIQSQCTDTRTTWAPSRRIRASVPAGSTSMRASSCMIESCCVDAAARVAGTENSTAATAKAPSSAANRRQPDRIYLTVTCTVRL